MFAWRWLLYCCTRRVFVAACLQEFMENFRKAREEEEANRAMRAAKKLQEDQDAEEVSSVTPS